VTQTQVAAVVAEAMIRCPKLCGTHTTVTQAHAYLADDHVHALLVTRGGVLVAVVEREDLAGAGPEQLIWPLGRLGDRVVGVDDDLAVVSRAMAESGRRRLAVVDPAGRLAGLLCRKRSGRGFCSDEGVAARAASPALSAQPPNPDGARRAGLLP
jgi:predicted transcriptional regulator